jgi:hypothetical protein
VDYWVDQGARGKRRWRAVEQTSVHGFFLLVTPLKSRYLPWSACHDNGILLTFLWDMWNVTKAGRKYDLSARACGLRPPLLRCVCGWRGGQENMRWWLEGGSGVFVCCILPSSARKMKKGWEHVRRFGRSGRPWWQVRQGWRNARLRVGDRGSMRGS